MSLWIGINNGVYAQDDSKRIKWVKVEGDVFFPDSSLVLPSSLKVLSPLDSLLHVSYDLQSGRAKIIYNQRVDSILISYTVLPPMLAKPFYKRDPKGYSNKRFYTEKRKIFDAYVPDKREELFSSEGLNKSGNISRGISFGNNQNVFVNSVLNLQLEGRISEDVKITAVISDQNIPVQPEGNTQQLQQFDKVFIQLEGKNAKITAGDIVMRNNSSEFLRYYRNVQGGQGEILFNKDSVHKSFTSAGVAIAKGRFNSMLFAPGQQDSLIEGVQGPYRLRGPKNERFIIILSNSEKVYVDGRLVQRGFDFDYVIDYNTAEITFTNKILITKFTRLRVDFEYSDKIFGRLITNASHAQTINKFSYAINYYQERDNPNNPLNVTLRDRDKLLLSQIGDSLNNAVASGADSVGFFEGQVLYKKTLIQGREVYIYSSDPDSAYYSVQFTYRGINRGDYNQSNSTVNGKVYQYVGEGAGSYAPVKVLATPKVQNMVTAMLKYDLKPSDFIYAEVAQSKNDLNLYSKIDSKDDAGRSIKGGYINKGKTFLSSKNYQWNGVFGVEYNQKSFVSIDRFRAPEFERDWSEDVNVKGDNYMLNAGFGLYKDGSNNFSYKLTRRVKEGNVNGIQNYFQLNQKKGKINFLSNAFIMNNDKQLQKSHWQRYSLNTFIDTRYITPGLIYSADKNIVEDKSTREINGSGMYFDEMKFYVRNPDSLGVKYFSDYSYRRDKSPMNGDVVLSSIAQTSNTGIRTFINNKHEIGGTFTYRLLDNKIPSLIATPNEETILSRVDLNSNLFKSHVKSFLTVTTGTGRELQRQYLFIPSYNNNGNFIF
ncbi:MAG TPA: hypothetical protein VF691_22160, partial [Cytophagaceae bacterium]